MFILMVKYGGVKWFLKKRYVPRHSRVENLVVISLVVLAAVLAVVLCAVICTVVCAVRVVVAGLILRLICAVLEFLVLFFVLVVIVFRHFKFLLIQIGYAVSMSGIRISIRQNAGNFTR